jgi:hypothetical protein
MIRGIVHALGILALATLGVVIQLTIEEPWPIAGQVGVGAWVWGGLGVTCAVACAVAAVASGMGWRPRPLVLLALPCALLVAAGGVLFVGVGDVLSTYDEKLTDRLYEIRWGQLVWRGTFVWMEAALAAMWAGIGFAAAVAVAGARAPLPGQRRGLDVVALVPGPLAAGWAVAVFLLFYGSFDLVLTRDGVGAAFSAVGETLAGLGHVEAAWLLLPLAPGLLILLILPSLFRPLQVVGRVDPGGGDGGRRCGLALAGLGGVAAAAALGIVAFGRATTLHNIIAARSANTVAEVQVFLSMLFVSGGRVGHAAVSTTAATLLALAGLALLLLLTGRPRLRPLALPGLVVGLAFLLSSGLRLGATARVGVEFGPVCEDDCTELDRATALLRGAEAIRNDQMRVDPCERNNEVYITRADLRLPVVPADACLMVGTLLKVGRQTLGLNLGEWTLDALEDPQLDGRNAGRFDASLRNFCETEKEIITRNLHRPLLRPHPVLVLAVDQSHRWATVQRVLDLAGEAGWCDTEFVVAAPGFEDPRSYRRIGTGLPPATSIRPELIHGLVLSGEGKTLITSSGERHALSATPLSLDPAIQRLRPSPAQSTLVLCPADDRSLEEVLRVRQSLARGFARVIFDPTCDDIWLGGSPGSFCERVGASGGDADPEGGGAEAEAVDADVL